MLGFDTSRSADHEWGPRLEIFLTAEDNAQHGAAIRRTLAETLPKEIRGTHFEESDDPLDPVGRMQLTDGPVSHRVDVYDVDGWLAEQLGVRPAGAKLTTREWLAVPQQRLAETTGGAVFHDGLGTLTDVRRWLAWYPDQGGICWLASGSASRRKKRSWVAARKSVTTSVRPSWPLVWSVT
ncbi:hypothetical protein GCM10010304_82130 [Streptomyces roseoviolaceus]